jgi:trimethylamine---corrinoid protein Co-methyltransferase
MKLKNIEALSKTEIEKIDYYSRELLNDKGVLIPSDKIKDVLKRKGIKFDGFVAKFPDKIIDNSLKTVPEVIKIYNRDLEYSLNIGEGRKYASGHNAIYIINRGDKKRIPIKKKEVGNFALISDYLDEIDVVGIEAYPQDVNPKSSILHGLDVVLNNTSKPVYFSPETVDETIYLLKIVEIISPDFKNYPIGVCQVSPHSPLAWDEKTAEALVLLAENKFPISVLPAPFSYVSAPITLAGEILQSNVELLSSLAISQLINPGTPFIFGNAKSAADVATGEYLIGTPECNLFRIASAQLAKYYHIPSHSIGPDSDSHLLDEQNGLEKMSSLISEAVSGVNLIVNAGMFATGLTVSYEQLLIDAEMIRFIERYIKGIDLSEEKLAYTSLKEVAFGKDFLTDPLTLKYLRSDEHVRPLVSNRKNYEIWRRSGSPDVVQNSVTMVEEILKNYKSQLLNTEKQRKIEEIILEFESRFK